MNAIAAAMAEGTRIKPGDRYALVAETVARTVDSACTLDHVSLGESRFVLPSRRLEERTLGAASWFYANFMDVLTYPVLACLLQPSRAPSSSSRLRRRRLRWHRSRWRRSRWRRRSRMRRCDGAGRAREGKATRRQRRKRKKRGKNKR